MTSARVLAGLLVAAALSTAAGSASTSCMNVTISDILDIGTCIGNSANYCGSTSTSATTQGISKITNCLIQGIVKYGSPEGIVNSLVPLLLIIVNRDIPTGINIPMLGNMSLCNSSGCLSFFMRNDSCDGAINIGLPSMGNISSCVGDTAQMCTAGSPTTTNMVQSTVQAIVCILSQLPANQFLTVIRSTTCNLIKAVNSAVQGNSMLQLAFMGFSAALSASTGVICPLSG
ncbi:uncharacterized protein [Dermacentor albipictus]|uniref:uncharacterized protein n=1 Tax=Dermacentor albipictus TaxID=60249 RepID=UPI0031FD408C